MKVKQLYAIHTDGRKLYFPQWDDNGEIVDTGLLTAAVSVDQDGKTFPEGSIWVRASRSWKIQAGWTLVKSPTGQNIPQTVQAAEVSSARTCRTAKRRTRRTCPCTRTFLAKRTDAKYCSQPCRRRYGNASQTV